MLTKEIYTALVKNVKSVDYVVVNRIERPQDLEQTFKQVLQDRMEHCETELRTHISESVSTCSGLVIGWKTGHFAYPVYEHMSKQVNISYKKWDIATWQQIVRHLFLNKGRYGEIEDYLFRYATEALLCLKWNEHVDELLTLINYTLNRK